MGSRRFSSAGVSLCALLTASALSLSACGGPEKAAPDTGSNRAHAIGAGDRYVAIGDSYTAAYRTGETDPRSGACFRSLANYPHQVAEKLGLDLEDVSCGGATTHDALSPQRLVDGTEAPAQIEAVTKDTDLVTISLGANDIDLYGAVIGSCVTLATSQPTGSPCADLAAGAPEAAQRKLDALNDTLVSTVRAVEAKAPKTRVILVGYPQVFPPRLPCASVPIATGDVAFAFRAAHAVTNEIRSVAADLKIEYVDAWNATEGHDICSDSPWIAGAKPNRDDAVAYHPYPEEQRAVADLIVSMLD